MVGPEVNLKISKNLKIRLLSGMCILPIPIIAIWNGSWIFVAFVGLGLAFVVFSLAFVAFVAFVGFATLPPRTELGARAEPG